MKKVLLVLVAALALALVGAGAAKADPQISATATVGSNSSVSVNWNIPAGEFGGAICFSTDPATDGTGEMPCNDDNSLLMYDVISPGATTYVLPLGPVGGYYENDTTSLPATFYTQVQLIDPFGDGSCTHDFGVDCDSQVVTCNQTQPGQPGYYKTVVVTAGYYKTVVVRGGHYTKKLVKRGHWIKRHGHRVWVKARYKKVFHPAVTKQVWIPPVTKQVWVPPVPPVAAVYSCQ